ncbi:beta-lactamase/transpeptidase-like protein [Bombardia bombarda]|uniref:Beta-lactamase/transpeptidase-like protein n=1 Tax=Bombardia bombarda TaxID=252184 RepID=A0AA39WH33_9PEZI|nr:beta-lactamase/transpeptidase-like protein [Bombardia bombarda]
MEGTAEKLRDADHAINVILSSSGTAGAAIGVVHHGEVIHTAGYGFRDVQRQLPMIDRALNSGQVMSFRPPRLHHFISRLYQAVLMVLRLLNPSSCGSENKMKPDLMSRLAALEPVVKSICSATGAPGLSFGVAQAGNITYTSHYGHRDVKQALSPDSDTIYGVASLTKSFVASAMGILVDEGKVSWNTCVKSILPELNTQDPLVTEQLSVADLFIHNSGGEDIGTSTPKNAQEGKTHAAKKTSLQRVPRI